MYSTPSGLRLEKTIFKTSVQSVILYDLVAHDGHSIFAVKDSPITRYTCGSYLKTGVIQNRNVYPMI